MLVQNFFYHIIFYVDSKFTVKQHFNKYLNLGIFNQDH